MRPLSFTWINEDLSKGKARHGGLISRYLHLARIGLHVRAVVDRCPGRPS